MPKLTRGAVPRPGVHRSSCKEMFPVCVSPGLHFVEWTNHIVDLSYFLATYSVHSSGIHLQHGVSLAARFFNNFSNEDATAQGELPHFHQVIQSLARDQLLR